MEVQTTTTNGVTSVQASQGRFYDTLNANTQNASISWRNSMPATGGFAPSMVQAFYNDILLCRNGSYPALGDTWLHHTHTSQSTSMHPKVQSAKYYG